MFERALCDYCSFVHITQEDPCPICQDKFPRDRSIGLLGVEDFRKALLSLERMQNIMGCTMFCMGVGSTV